MKNPSMIISTDPLRWWSLEVCKYGLDLTLFKWSHKYHTKLIIIWAIANPQYNIKKGAWLYLPLFLTKGKK